MEKKNSTTLTQHCSISQCKHVQTHTHTTLKENKLMFLFSFYYTATYFLFGFFFENIIKHFPQRTLQCFSYFVFICLRVYSNFPQTFTVTVCVCFYSFSTLFYYNFSFASSCFNTRLLIFMEIYFRKKKLQITKISTQLWMFFFTIFLLLWCCKNCVLCRLVIVTCFVI